MTGVTTANLPSTRLADSVLVNREGSTAQMDINLLAAQIAVETPGPRYATRAALYADLAWPADSQGIVWGDTTEAYRGLYRKSGASGAGAWARYADLPLSTVSLALLDAKAPLASPALTGVPTAPTAAAGTNTTQLANTAFVQAALAALANAAPATLDTLNELAVALGNDPNFATTMATALSLKASTAALAATDTRGAASLAAGHVGALMITASTTYPNWTVSWSQVRVFISGTAASIADLAETTLASGDVVYVDLVGGTSPYPVVKAALDSGLQADFAAGRKLLLLRNTSGTLAGLLAGQARTAAQIALRAPLASPALTGVPTAPTAAAGTSTTQLASTAFVQAALAALVNAAPGTLDTLNELATALGSDPNFASTMASALALKAPLASPALTGVPTAPTAAAGTSTTQLASTAFVQAALAALVNAAPGTLDTLNELATALGNDANFASTMASALALKASLASPALTGVPTAPTAAAGSNTTQIATTAFVDAARALLAAAVSGEAATRATADTALTDTLALKAPLASPALTGAPTAPTAAAGTATTQIATTAFVDAARALLAAAVSGEATARATADTALTDALALKAPLASPVFTGTVGGIDAAMLAETPAAKVMTAAERAALASVGTHRDRIGAAVLAARDPLGRFVGFDEAGRAVATGFLACLDRSRDALRELEVLVKGSDGRIVLAADDQGRLRGQFALEAFDNHRERMREMIALLTAADGRLLLAAREDGLDLAWSEALFTRLRAALVDTPIGFDPGTRAAFNLRAGASFLYASVRLPDGYVGDLRQIPGRSTAVPHSTASLRQIEGWGQSNAAAGPGPVGQPPVIGVLAPDYLLHTDVDSQSSGGVFEVAGAATDFVSRAEPLIANQAQTPSAMMAYALHRLDLRAGRHVPGTVIGTVWQGGQTIDKFFPGVYPSLAGSESPLYENLRAHFDNVARVATRYGRGVEPNILWIQGEGDADHASYLAQMTDLVEDVVPGFGAVTLGGAVPHVFVAQTQTGTAADVPERGSGQAQLDLARAKLGAGVTLVGPMYQGPVHDNIHLNNPGRMMMGEVAALAYQRVRIEGGLWHPLWPVAGGITRTGAVITIPMQLPPGATILSWDSDWIAPIANKGFWYDDDTEPSAAIASVAISGTSIVLTLAADPGSAGNKRIGYGTRKLTETPGWASSRGQLYADSGIRSPFHELGHPVPPTIRLYCTRFTESLS